MAGREDGHSHSLTLIVTPCYLQTAGWGLISSTPRGGGSCRSSIPPTWGAEGQEGRRVPKRSDQSSVPSRGQSGKREPRWGAWGSRDPVSEETPRKSIDSLKCPSMSSVWLSCLHYPVLHAPHPHPAHRRCHKVLICWKHLSELVQQRRHEGKPPRWGSENPGFTQ